MIKNFCGLLLILCLILSFLPCFGENADLRIFTEEFAPFNFEKDDGSIAGQSTEIVQGILNRLNLHYEIELKSWSIGYEFVLNNTNSAIFSTSRTAEREKLFKWVGPIGADEYLFYGLKKDEIKLQSLEEAKKISAIGVVKDDVRHQFLQKDGFTNLMLFENDVICYKALLQGKVNLVVGSVKTMPEMSSLAGIELSEIASVYSIKKTPLYIAFNNGVDDKIVLQWQAVLDEMKTDGTYQKITGEAVDGKDENQSKLYSTQNVLPLLTGFIDAELVKYLDGLELLTLTNQVQSLKWKKIKSLVIAREKMLPAGRIWFLRPDGSYYTSVDDLTSKNLKTRSYFPGLMQGNKILGSVVTSKSTGRTVAIAAAPIKIKHKVKGALGTSIYLQDLNDNVQKSFPISSHQMFMAVASNGIIALHSDASLIGQNIEIISTKISASLTENKGDISFNYAGRKWQGKYIKSSLTGWCIILVNVYE